MECIKAMRMKYQKRKMKLGFPDRYPPGGADIQMLCDKLDLLVDLTRDMQCWIPTEKQNYVQQRLFFMDRSKI
jgi:hypothetical protein